MLECNFLCDLDFYSEIPFNWDDYGSIPPSDLTIYNTKKFVNLSKYILNMKPEFDGSITIHMKCDECILLINIHDEMMKYCILDHSQEAISSKINVSVIEDIVHKHNFKAF